MHSVMMAAVAWIMAWGYVPVIVLGGVGVMRKQPPGARRYATFVLMLLSLCFVFPS